MVPKTARFRVLDLGTGTGGPEDESGICFSLHVRGSSRRHEAPISHGLQNELLPRVAVTVFRSGSACGLWQGPAMGGADGAGLRQNPQAGKDCLTSVSCLLRPHLPHLQPSGPFVSKHSLRGCPAHWALSAAPAPTRPIAWPGRTDSERAREAHRDDARNTESRRQNGLWTYVKGAGSLPGSEAQEDKVTSNCSRFRSVPIPCVLLKDLTGSPKRLLQVGKAGVTVPAHRDAS